MNNDTILIVDDNPQNIQVLAKTLAENDYELAISMSGQEALDFLATDQPDLILLDVMMPEMDGFDTCRRLKRSNHTKDIPVIFLTAKTETDDLIEGFEAGGVDYITKPFNTRELLIRVRTHIDLRKAKEEIKILKGFIPICAYCKKIRNDQGYWDKLEAYIEQHSEATFSHGMCPDCYKKTMAEFLKDQSNDPVNDQ